MKENLQQVPKRLQDIHSSYKAYYPAIFFVLGFLFDIMTLGRIDNWITIAQQGLFLIAIHKILYYRTLEQKSEFTISDKWQKVWRHNNEIMHFLLGSLLSAFTIFYFVSASLSASLIFMLLLTSLLILNELPLLQSARLQIKYALFAVCVFSYLAYLTPMALGFIGFIPLLTALVISGIVFLSIKHQLKKQELPEEVVQRSIIYPVGTVFTVIAILYFLKILPPIPIAAQYIGIYHNIEKKQGEFHLSYERPTWKFWQNGAESFIAQDGDRIYCFARIFSPVYFNDSIVFHWLIWTDAGWKTSDKVPVKITGGRDEGFRAYTSKSNYQAGEWMIKLETLDQRELGRIYFDIENRETALSTEARNFKVDIH